MKLCERISEGTFIIGDSFYDRPGNVMKESIPDPIPSSGIVFKLEDMTSVSDIFHCANKFSGESSQ